MGAVALRPPNTLFKGVFMTPGAFGSGWDFNANIKPQFDTIKSLGCNLAVPFGDVTWKGNATSTLPLYLTARKQWWDYLLQIGQYFLPYGVAAISTFGSTTVAQAAVILAADAAQAALYPNCVGYCCTDESASDPTNLTTIYNAVKAAVPTNFAITCTSNPCGNAASAAGNAFEYDGGNSSKATLDAIIGLCDFFCFNPQAANVPSDLNNLNTAFPAYQVAMGGSVAKVTDGTFNTVFTALAALMGQKNINLNGVFILQDFDANALGLYSGPAPTGPRTSRITTMQAGNGTIVAPIATRTSRGSPVRNQYLLAGY